MSVALSDLAVSRPLPSEPTYSDNVFGSFGPPIANLYRVGALWFETNPSLSVNAHLLPIQQIEELGSLQPDWDGYGAVPISSEAQANTMRVLSVMPSSLPTPQLTPNSNGTISCEWTSPGGHAHVEVGKTRYSGYIENNAGHVQLLSGTAGTPDSTIGQAIASTLYSLPANTVVSIVVGFVDGLWTAR